MAISAIIPAYNEEARIGGVLEIIEKHPLIDEIIVIDDGSVDNTSMVAQNYRVKLVRLPENRGKAEAIKVGLTYCRGEYVLMLDADLIGLRLEHINDLLDPLKLQEVQMTVGIFKGGRPLTDLAQKIAPNLSGQRGLKATLIKDIMELDTRGYSLEMALSKLVKEKNITTKKIFLDNISHVIKEEKLGLVQGAMWRMKMYKDIIKFWLH